MPHAGTVQLSFNPDGKPYLARYISADNRIDEAYVALLDGSGIEWTVLNTPSARGMVALERILHPPIRELFAGKALEDVRKRYPQYILEIKALCFC